MTAALETLSAGKLQAAYDKAEAASSNVCSALIAAGRGAERGSETRKCTDPLALRYIEVNDRFRAIVDEMEARKRWHGSLRPIRRPAWCVS